MENKIIMIVSICFALVFVMVMSFLFGGILDLGQSAQEDLDNMKDIIADAELEQYNDTIVSGDTVISTINKMHENKNGVKMSYLVVMDTLKTQYGYKAIKVDGSAGYAGDEYVTYVTSTKPSSSTYISPVQEFRSTVVINSNDVVVGIVFTKM